MSIFITNDYDQNTLKYWQNYIIKLADNIRASTRISENVYQAFAVVPRHIFIQPYFKNNHLSISQCYEDSVIKLKMTEDGFASTSSVPSLMALMITQAQVNHGDKIVEIGTGSGYGAALLAEISGENGYVLTVDIDDELTSNAIKALKELNYSDRVLVRTEDGFNTKIDSRFNRLIATVSCPIIPNNWHSEARTGLRLIVPLQLPDAGPLLCLDKQADGRLIGTASTWVIFVDPQGKCVELKSDSKQELAQKHMKNRVRKLKLEGVFSYDQFCALRTLLAITGEHTIDLTLSGHFPDLVCVDDIGLIVLKETELITYGKVDALIKEFVYAHKIYQQMGNPPLSRLRFSVPPESNSIVYRKGDFQIGVSI